MNAMLLDGPGRPLRAVELADPRPGPGQVLVRIRACAVCRTDLHLVDGDLPSVPFPVIPGHEIVGHVVELGPGAERWTVGQRVGIPWLGWTCGGCGFCRSGRENLCAGARFTGYTLPGGYAGMVVADERFCFAIPASYSDAEAAPLLCAGLIGYRSLRLAGEAQRLGIYGFGAAAHLVTQVARFQGRQVFAFTRPGDAAGQEFARSVGAVWAGGSDERPPELLHAALIFAPVGSLVPPALASVKPGGRVVCGGIHMSDIPGFAYRLLWGERQLMSVANLTRRDGEEFLALAPQVPVRAEIQTLPLAQANEALDGLRRGRVRGAAVLVNA